jgi:polyhydroxyalkanoate synthase
MDAFCQLNYALLDALRRAQGDALGAFGLGPAECDYHLLASGVHWRLRAYRAATRGLPVLIVAAPIKRPYIWDLAPARSAIRYCLNQRLSVYLLEWLPPKRGQASADLNEYAGQAISECLAKAADDAGGEKPFLMGHSLGGTLAAIYAALDPQGVRGLLLLGAPLCFQPGVSRFRDALVSLAPSGLSDIDVVPGSLLSQVSALASPSTFIWSRLMDAALSLTDPAATAIHARVERWALDEAPLPGRLVHEIVDWLYREDRFRRGTLPICGRKVGPAGLRLPTLMVINTADEIAPPASVTPFVQAMPDRTARIIEYAGESGVGLQHLAILVGRQAYVQVWPEIISWLKAPRQAELTHRAPYDPDVKAEGRRTGGTASAR